MLDRAEKTSTLWKNYKGYGSTHSNRAAFEELYRAFNSISIESVLTYGDKIPRFEKDELFNEVKTLDETNTIAYFQESLYKKIQVVKKHINVQTSPISANCNHSFVISIDGQQVKNIIPFDYSDTGIYNYVLTNAFGEPIPFGVCDWIVDTNSALLTFNNGVPEGVSAENPPIISFYQYVGPVGEKKLIDALTLGVPNIPIPSGSTVGNITTLVAEYLENVEKNYFTKYGFNGTDVTPGIGLQYNIITQVVDTTTSDPLMGYDDNSHSQVVNILTHKRGICKELDPMFTIFASEGISVGEHTIQVLEEAEREGVVKIDTEDGFFVLKAEPGTYTITVEETNNIYTTLLVKDNETQELELFYPRQDLNLTIQVPIFANLNTLPPHLKLTTISNSYTDHITPQYYGPRLADFVIAAADSTTSWRSADYVVYNTEKSNIQTAIAQAEGNHIFLRNGQYLIPNQTVIENLTMQGETSKDIHVYGDEESTVYIKNGTVLKHIKFFNTALYIEGDAVLKDIQCNKIYIKGGQVVCENITAETVNIFSGNILTFNSTIQNLNTSAAEEDTSTLKDENLSGSNDDSSDEENEQQIGITIQLFNTSIVQNCNNIGASIELYSSYVHNFKNEIGLFFIQSSRIENFDILDTNPNSIVDTTSISKVVHLPDFIKIDASYITKFSSAIDRPVYPNESTIPFYTSFEKRVYAKVPKPFVYHEDTNILELTLDTIEHTMFINEKGELQCRFFTSKEIKIDSKDNITTQIEKVYNEHADTVLKDARPKNVDEAILDLYWSKADLKNGKLPIDQLPDSVAYGGLSFVGMWQFEDHNGEYPTFDDVDTSFESDDKYSTLQNGWFFIVSASHKEDDPVFPQQSALQKGESEPQEYTAGDWLIYSNGIFKKLDRAYLDPVYSRLPELAPVKNGENVHWDINEGGTGLLKLDYETLAEALRLINGSLLKLSPDRPASIRDISVVLDEGNTTATIQEFIEIGNGQLTAYLEKKTQTSWETGTGNIAVKQQGIHDVLPLEHFFYPGESSSIKILDKDEDITETGTIHIFDPYELYKLGFKSPTVAKAAEVSVTIPLEEQEGSYIKDHIIKYTQYEVIPHPQFLHDKDILEGETQSYTWSHRKFYRLEDCTIQPCNKDTINISDLNTALFSNRMGGIGYIPNGQYISGTFEIENFARYNSIGTDAQVEVFARFNENPLRIEITNLYLDKTNTEDDTYKLVVTFNTHIQMVQELSEFGTLVVEAQATNFGAQTGLTNILTIQNLHIINPVIFENVVESGDSIYPVLNENFGTSFKQKVSPKECIELQFIDVQHLQGWGWSTRKEDIYKFNEIGDVEYQEVDAPGITIGDVEYRFITFKKSLDQIKDLSGFTILLDWDGESIPSINTLTGCFEDVMVQNCVTSVEAPHVFTSDANRPVPTFFEAKFTQGEESLYPGYSNIHKRYITFGRKPVPVQDIYVRIGLPKRKGYILKDLKIVVDPQPQY